MKYGVIDREDGTWIGNSNGPILFDTAEFGQIVEGLAQVAAQTLETQVYGDDLSGYYRAALYPDLSAHKIGDIPILMDSLMALRPVEGTNDQGGEIHLVTGQAAQ